MHVNKRRCGLVLTVAACGLLQKTPMKIVEEEEEEVAEIQPDPLHQLILHFSHNALTERRWEHMTKVFNYTEFCFLISIFAFYISDFSPLLHFFSHLEEDPLYIAYADMMAKVSLKS